MEGSNIKIVLIGVLVVVQLLWGCPAFLHYDYAYISLAHHFFHANILHLAVNCLSLWTIFRKDYIYKSSILIWAFVIASLSWFCTSSDVVGFSNFIFAILGLRTPSIRNSWWTSPSVIFFLGITALMAFLPQVSAVTHIVSFSLGSIVAGVNRIIEHISRDFSRATHN